jgi:sortase A
MEATPSTAVRARSSKGRTVRRAAGTTMFVGGLAMLIWAFVVWQWNDPLTATYTRWQQHHLAKAHDKLVAEFRPAQALPTTATPVDEAAVVAKAARRLRAAVGTGAPIGEIVVTRLHLHMLMVNGVDSDTLKKGPGRDQRTFMPGQGQLVYIAGHRTTYLAPFSDIDKMRRGDSVTLKMPYATFTYAVTGHSIVNADDLSVLKSHGREVVALQACHPRFFATQRYIVWAKPMRVTLPSGRSYAPL